MCEHWRHKAATSDADNVNIASMVSPTCRPPLPPSRARVEWFGAIMGFSRQAQDVGPRSNTLAEREMADLEVPLGSQERKSGKINRAERKKGPQKSLRRYTMARARRQARRAVRKARRVSRRAARQSRRTGRRVARRVRRVGRRVARKARRTTRKGARRVRRAGRRIGRAKRIIMRATEPGPGEETQV
jgi:hypothetical protein